MAVFKPTFPFKSNQIILSSDRVVLHTKTDAIFLFGKAAVSLSSPKTINLDSNEAVLIDSPKILLGNQADTKGQPVTKALELTIILNQLLSQLASASVLLAQASTSDPGATAQAVRSAGQIIYKECERLQGVLGSTPPTNPIMSNVTYTK